MFPQFLLPVCLCSVSWRSGSLISFCSSWLLLYLLLSHPFSHLAAPPVSTWGWLSIRLGGGGSEEEEEETDGGEDGGLGAAGTRSVCVYTCLYILWWIYIWRTPADGDAGVTSARADLSEALNSIDDEALIETGNVGALCALFTVDISV